MKNILARGGIEFLAVFIGIILSLWVDDNRELRLMRENNTSTLNSLKSEVELRVDYVKTKITQYERDIMIGDHVIAHWRNIDIDSIFS